MSTSNDNSATPDEIKEFFSAVNRAEKEGNQAAIEATSALPRLVKVAYGNDNSQAQIISACLASIYNGDEARPVQLDSIRRLDWSLQKDLAAVIIGIGKGNLSDSEIRKEFERLAGSAGVEWLHWHTTGGAHRRALSVLIQFIRDNGKSSSAKALLEMLLSISQGAPADLSRLNYIDDELTRAFVLVLDGLFGRDQGLMHIEDIAAALDRLSLPTT